MHRGEVIVHIRLRLEVQYTFLATKIIIAVELAIVSRRMSMTRILHVLEMERLEDG